MQLSHISRCSSIIFLLSQVVGYSIYLIVRDVFYKKRNSLKVKAQEDEVYDKLISLNLYNNKTEINNNIFEFNNLAFNAKTTANNVYDIINSFDEFKSKMEEDLNKARKYIIFEIRKFNHKYFDSIKNIIIEKAKANIEVKFVYDKMHNITFIKQLKKAGVKVYRFSKNNTIGNVYANLRNMVTIDGEVIYLANFNTSNNQLKFNKEINCSFLKLKGDIVQDVDVQIRKDAIFASGKYIPYDKRETLTYNNNCAMQLLTNSVNTDLELALIKAICMSKKSIQMELSSFIPTESVMSLLKFAINSNIDVRLMIPKVNDRHGKYYASRAYAKELALMGANVYLFDGYINFNTIIFDDEFVFTGSFIVDREHLNTSPQAILVIKDAKAVKQYNEIFNNAINNSYRINNAKFMLLREKFFKNFV